MSLRRQALLLLQIRDPDEKASRTLALQDPGTATGSDETLAEPAHLPGRPERPRLVPPSQLVQRAVGTLEGRSALLHALAHIEHNAINLALDACWRFGAMPDAYYRDWLAVARDEARHFCLLRDHLATLGCRYGDFPGHDGLWEMVAKTRGDVLARMALVPRTLEARGLDATPLIQAKLRKVATPAALAAVDILDTILAEEVGHVAIGNHWFQWLCQRDGVDGAAFYPEAALRYRAPSLKPPFNLVARRAAGFTAAEIAALPQ